MILLILSLSASGRVVLISLVSHGILKGVKDSEGIGKGCKGDDEAKLLYKRRSLHEGKAWAAAHWISKTALNFKDRRQGDIQQVQTMYV